jgi:hypothetical protein
MSALLLGVGVGAHTSWRETIDWLDDMVVGGDKELLVSWEREQGVGSG